MRLTGRFRRWCGRSAAAAAIFRANAADANRFLRHQQPAGFGDTRLLRAWNGGERATAPPGSSDDGIGLPPLSTRTTRSGRRGATRDRRLVVPHAGVN